MPRNADSIDFWTGSLLEVLSRNRPILVPTARSHSPFGTLSNCSFRARTWNSKGSRDLAS